MATLILRYELQPDTGLPQATVVEGTLTELERRSLDAELRRNYERLVRLRPPAVRFRTRLRGLPEQASFQLRILPGASPRCPTLLLRHAARTPPAAQPAAGGNGSPWVDGFLSELRELLAAGHLTGRDGEEQAVLERRIGRLVTWHGQQPARLARFLLEGFVERLRRRCGHGSPSL